MGLPAFAQTEQMESAPQSGQFKLVRTVDVEAQNAHQKSAAFAVHDAKNKLASLRLNLVFVQMVLRELEVPVDVHAALDDILECNDQLEGLLQEALLASRGVAAPARRVRVSARSLVEQAVRRSAKRAEAHQLKLTARCTSDAPVLVDQGMLLRVLDNLIDNAIRYSPTGGTIEIGCSASTEHVEIWVADEGPGVPASEQDKIFEEFFTSEHEAAKRGANAGLGLAFCRRVSEEHGGTIDVCQRKTGGARFTVQLPMV